MTAAPTPPLITPPAAGELLEAGCWRSLGPARSPGRGALFLDRDGVVVEEVDYLRRVEDVALIPGGAALIARFNAAGVPVVVVTNQSGVARGYLDWARFEDIQREIARRLAGEGAWLDGVFACGYHEKGEGELARAAHGWRKPAPGMFLAAAEALGIDLSRSAMVGDRTPDLAAARAAGLRRGLHVATGHGAPAAEQAAARALDGPDFAVQLGADITAADAFLPALTS